MLRALIPFGSLIFAVILVANVVSTTVFDFKHPAGPCSVLDNRRCYKR